MVINKRLTISAKISVPGDNGVAWRKKVAYSSSRLSGGSDDTPPGGPASRRDADQSEKSRIFTSTADEGGACGKLVQSS